MVKFKIFQFTDEAIKKSIQNKKVANVAEHEVDHVIHGRYKLWKGTTELEYFTISFIKGIITISICEREYQIMDNIFHYAVLKDLSEELERVNKDNKSLNPIIQPEYNFDKDLDTIKFSDVMRILKWKYVSRKVKVDTSFSP